MIPKKLHQIWLGNQDKRPIEWMDSWKDKHPTWEYRLWTEADFQDLADTPGFKRLSYSGQSDVLRYQILYEHGGVYVDADSECLRPIDDLLDNEAFCVWENEYVTTGLMLGAFMGTVPNNPFFEALLDEIGNQPTLEPEWFTVGPGLFTRMIGKLKYTGMHIYPSHYFSPKHHTGLEYKGKDKPYANHFWDNTAKLTSTITKEGFEYRPVDNDILT